MAKYGEDDNKPMEWGKDDDDEKRQKMDERMMVESTVTSRRQHKVSKEDVQKAKDEYVSLEWDDVFPKKPKERLRWLDKAFKAAKEGRVKARPVFDIIAHRKFVEGLKGSIASDTLNLIRGNLDLFTAKQQKQLTSENFELYRKYAPINVLDSDEDEADAPPLPPPPKVEVEPKDKKRKRAEHERIKALLDDEEYDSDMDTDTKRQRLLSKGIERRIDAADGQAYTLEEFIAEYGGSGTKPPDQWENAKHTSFIFKA